MKKPVFVALAISVINLRRKIKLIMADSIQEINNQKADTEFIRFLEAEGNYPDAQFYREQSTEVSNEQ